MVLESDTGARPDSQLSNTEDRWRHATDVGYSGYYYLIVQAPLYQDLSDFYYDFISASHGGLIHQPECLFQEGDVLS